MELGKVLCSVLVTMLLYIYNEATLQQHSHVRTYLGRNTLPERLDNIYCNSLSCHTYVSVSNHVSMMELVRCLVIVL